jgi:hypothetical protein
VITSNDVSWTRDVKHKGELRNAYASLVGKLEIKRSLGIPDVGGRTILKWFLKK